MRRKYPSGLGLTTDSTNPCPARHLWLAGMPTALRRRSHVSRFSLRGVLFAVTLVPVLVITATAQGLSGYPGLTPEPSAASRFSSSVKNGFSKMSHALTPQISTRKAPDPISLSVPAKPSPEFYAAAARMSEQSGDLAKAELHYRQALELNPIHPDALMGYAHMLDRQAKLAEAARLYQQIVQTYPGNSTAHNDLGICYARQGKLDEAVASLEKAVQLQPKQARYRNNIATILVQSKHLDEAFAHLSAVHPEAVAYYNLGYLLHKAGDKKGAARLFQEALVVDPTLAQARVWLEQISPEQIAAQPATPPQVPQPARQPQIMAQRPAPSPTVIIPPAGSAAPMPPTGSPASLPQILPTPNRALPGQTTPQHLAPLPSIKPLPPIQGGY